MIWIDSATPLWKQSVSGVTSISLSTSDVIPPGAVQQMMIEEDAYSDPGLWHISDISLANIGHIAVSTRDVDYHSHLVLLYYLLGGPGSTLWYV